MHRAIVRRKKRHASICRCLLPCPSVAAPAAAAPACPKAELTLDGAPHRVQGLVWPHSLDFPMLPKYPASLGPHGPSGIVLIHYIIDRDGRICDPTAKSIDGPKELADVTQKWLTTSQFAPAMKDGQPVVAEVKRALNFSPHTMVR
jgi:hypothetical protein